MTNTNPVSVLVAGMGHMGISHAKAYHQQAGYDICGLVNRSKPDLPEELKDYPVFSDFKVAFDELQPQLASISTYSDSHAEYAIHAMEAGAHVFIEKPLATNVADAIRVTDCAKANNRKLVVGYILRHHPSWVRLIQEARELGGPYVFRMNLNQQSSGPTWETHRRLMDTTPPIVDCGVHYVDVMCQITDANPIEVRGMGLRLSDQIAHDMYNYGHFQILFEDGSLGWYEAGWGPMMSESAYFVKDVVSPAGSVSIVVDPAAKSDDMNTHTKTSLLKVHFSQLNNDGGFLKQDNNISMLDEPGHDELCAREQAYMLKAITEDINLDRHMRDAVQSLKICIAADESVRSGDVVKL